jgi:hypothetical protein
MLLQLAYYLHLSAPHLLFDNLIQAIRLADQLAKRFLGDFQSFFVVHDVVILMFQNAIGAKRVIASSAEKLCFISGVK